MLESKCVTLNDEIPKEEDDYYNECNFGTNCSYKLLGLENETTFDVPCPCGYNNLGKGYCPHFHEYFIITKPE